MDYYSTSGSFDMLNRVTAVSLWAWLWTSMISMQHIAYRMSAEYTAVAVSSNAKRYTVALDACNMGARLRRCLCYLKDFTLQR